MALGRFKHLTSGTTTLASGSAHLWTVNVNTAAASSTVTIYNNAAASGEVVAVIDSASKGSHGYGIYCEGGLTVVIAGGTPDVTVGYA